MTPLPFRRTLKLQPPLLGLVVLFALLTACERSPLSMLVSKPAKPIEVNTYRLPLPPDSAGMFQYPVKLVNVNGDENPDLAVQRLRPNNGIYVALGTRNGWSGFEEWVQGFGGYPSEQDTLFADLNGDGLDDALVQKKNHFIWTTVSDGKRFIAKQKSYDGGAGVVDLPTFIADLTGDGCAEVFFHNLFDDICVAYNLCQPHLKSTKIRFEHHRPLFHIPDSSKHYAVLIGNANGDKTADFFIFTNADEGKHWKAHSLYVVPTERNGRATKPAYRATTVPVGGYLDEEFPPHVLDLNEDGLDDVLIRHYDGKLFALLNDGTGHFVLADTVYCCLGGSPARYYPMQARKFKKRIGALACIQRRGEVVLECTYLLWKEHPKPMPTNHEENPK